ncbi:MAG: DUF5652 family protein [Acidobacteriota bacterium]
MENVLTILTTPWIIVPLLFWSLAWKGTALWNAAVNRQLGWFIALLVINTVGLLEMVYLAFFRREVHAE